MSLLLFVQRGGAPSIKTVQMVRTTGIEPVTTSMSTKCSTAELSAHLTYNFDRFSQLRSRSRSTLVRAL